MLAALRSMERADVAVLVLDATEPAVDQDARLAGLVAEQGPGAPGRGQQVGPRSTKDPRTEKRTREELKCDAEVRGLRAHRLRLSALTGSKVEKVLDLAVALQEQFRIPRAYPRAQQAARPHGG